MSKDNNERNYGFKHIQPEYSWMTPGWIEELVKHEPDEEVRNHITEILEDLTNPESSRLESPTDKFDCLEEYWFNRIEAFNGKKLEDDERSTSGSWSRWISLPRMMPLNCAITFRRL